MNISSVVLSTDTATDTITDFEEVDRVRRRSADTCLFWLPSGAYTRSFWIGIFHIGNFCFWVPFSKQLLLRNCEVDFVEICNVYTQKMVIKATKSIFNSDKICRSYSDLNFGVTFFGTQCIFSQPPTNEKIHIQLRSLILQLKCKSFVSGQHRTVSAVTLTNLWCCSVWELRFDKASSVVVQHD